MVDQINGAIRTFNFELLELVQQSWTIDLDLQILIDEKEQEASTHPHYVWEQGILRRKWKIVMGNDVVVRNKLLEFYQASAITGHSRVPATYIIFSLVLEGTSFCYKEVIKCCDICQRNKYKTIASAGLLQHLPIPNQGWEDVSTDFIDGLPNFGGNTVILVVVDKLSKYALALHHSYTTVDVAQAYLDNIFAGDLDVFDRLASTSLDVDLACLIALLLVSGADIDFSRSELSLQWWSFLLCGFAFGCALKVNFVN
ncbi:hypothetical protein ACH5RR_000817 [Cinchona calisaya]|uniref:Uncharacterized protein n=1 Tax=Cinchona calisaya TaxID=153742 RepID=A0ABD3B1W7_9GENT